MTTATKRCLATNSELGSYAWCREPACACDNCQAYHREGVRPTSAPPPLPPKPAASKKKYDSTIARMAGNIAGALVGQVYHHSDTDNIAKRSVEIARAIVAELERTEPKTDDTQ